ncbi:F0F1 ATP synthase subunit A [Nonomuraea polychroma]|uniref:F0F1 ATP synthase subunit A n=1 Tax=Nonomuraea polychroma TaxID=46176 RepID=UPI003D929E7D
MRTTILITSPSPGQWQAPGLELFEFSPIIPGGPEWLTKPVLIALLSAIVVMALCWAAFAKPKLVPRGWQSLGEYAYVFVREQIAKPNLGQDSDRWMGFLLTVFLTVLIWNLMGVIPLIQFPLAAHIAFPLVLALTVYGVKIYLGVRHHGVRGYLRGIVHLESRRSCSPCSQACSWPAAYAAATSADKPATARLSQRAPAACGEC